MKYVCSLIVVDNIQRSRDFYEKTLGQKVKYDFGANVVYEDDFAIHFKEHFAGITAGKITSSIQFGSNSFELYFETDGLEEIYQELKSHQAEFLHEIEEQSWGQRVLRLYDPDKHLIEIGETLEAMVIRLNNQGRSLEEIIKKSSLPKDFVAKVINEHGKK